MANRWGHGHVIDSNDTANMGSSITSRVVPIDACIGVGVEVNVADASSLSGTFEVEISNSNVNWVPITLSGGGSSLTLTSDGTSFEDLVVNARFIRAKWTASAGDGKLDVYIYVKRA